MSSEYCYPGTTVLINHLDIRSQDVLDKTERYYTAFRAMEWRQNPLSKTFDLEHLKAIHSHLFQDVYPFAGQIRNVNIGKNNFWFVDRSMISRLSDYVFTELKSDRYLKGLSKEAFAEKAAYYYTEINYMHPFREGNGRAIREFFGQMAKSAGYELNWQEVPKEEYFQAVKQTDDPKQRADLVKVFEKCLEPVKEQQERLQWKVPEQPMKLKDVLKVAPGLPTATAKLQSADLNLYVEKFIIDEQGKYIKVQMKDASKAINIPLKNHPYLSHTQKSQMLDRVAASPKNIQLNKGMELGG